MHTFNESNSAFDFLDRSEGVSQSSEVVLPLSRTNLHNVIEFFKSCEDLRKMLMLNTKNLRHLPILFLTFKLIIISSFKDITNISKVASTLVYKEPLSCTVNAILRSS